MYAIGSEGAGVALIQQYLNQLALQRPDIFRGLEVDGKFGPLTRLAVQAFQQTQDIDCDGIVGRLTWFNLVKISAYDDPTFQAKTFGRFHYKLGEIPNTICKQSTFGGPDDKWDRCEGQALLPARCRAPKDIKDKFPHLVKLGLFRPEVLTLDEFPMTTDHKGRARRAGLSWALNPESWFAAMPVDTIRFHNTGYLNDAVPNIMVMTMDGTRAVILKVTDFGPGAHTGKQLDISDAAQAYLRVKEKKEVLVMWAGDFENIGPVELKVG